MPRGGLPRLPALIPIKRKARRGQVGIPSLYSPFPLPRARRCYTREEMALWPRSREDRDVVSFSSES